MERALTGSGDFGTPDGLKIKVALAVIFGDGPPRVEIESLKQSTGVVPVHAVDRAARCFLYQLTDELRRQAYRQTPARSDPKPKDRIIGRRSRVVT